MIGLLLLSVDDSGSILCVVVFCSMVSLLLALTVLTLSLIDSVLDPDLYPYSETSDAKLGPKKGSIELDFKRIICDHSSLLRYC